ncbi:UDP-N-acetylenolpyruvoylglucosamine reductase [Candidatus Desulfarcum epimagneticum]|uniref:UDP-N-acetylenolpyruvoylglucosamine reductase n=1 Tax=uncultured Desulfobacteraceae bacterium TaxID=218296 RepID=A0A484HM40_9BACT|nr:UDP-N-acetylenolpyruvoylglucosamine reductase [uncultured Desulfobacteraceae bacterium]
MLTDRVKKRLSRISGAHVRFDEPMSRHTSLGIGGPAEARATPESLKDLESILRMASGEGIPWMVIGGGTNLLVSDRGLPGLCISLENCLTRVWEKASDGPETVVGAMAGARLSTAFAFAAKRGLSGMNFALGIPGSVGGAAMVNAGSSHGSMEDVLEAATVLFPDGRKEKMSREAFRAFREKEGGRFPAGAIVSEVFFRLGVSEPGRVQKEGRMILSARNKTQPGGKSAGCFFKNPEKGRPAGMLLDMAGLKGKRIGGARISEVHANFILNVGNASAKDVLDLMNMARETVYEKFNVRLDPEVKIVGVCPGLERAL